MLFHRLDDRSRRKFELLLAREIARKGMRQKRLGRDDKLLQLHIQEGGARRFIEPLAPTPDDPGQCPDRMHRPRDADTLDAEKILKEAPRALRRRVEIMRRETLQRL